MEFKSAIRFEWIVWKFQNSHADGSSRGRARIWAGMGARSSAEQVANGARAFVVYVIFR